MEIQPFPVLIVSGAILLFAVFWSGIVMLGARYGGWGDLAKLYTGPPTMAGEACTFCSARMRWFYGYSRCLTITVSPQGIHMRPMLAFRIGHPPLLIPWDAVLEARDRSLSLFPRLDLAIRSADPNRPASIAFQGKRVIEALRRHAPASDSTSR